MAREVMKGETNVLVEAVSTGPSNALRSCRAMQTKDANLMMTPNSEWKRYVCVCPCLRLSVSVPACDT